MGRNAIETVLGAVVLFVACLFMIFAYNIADLRKVDGYEVTALFPMVDGVKEGTDVRINGVKVGSIARMRLLTVPGADEFKVEVVMTILPAVTIPSDTIAMIASESLMGGKYLALEMGVDEEALAKDGTGRMTRAQPPMRLDDLIGQVIYGGGKKDEGEAPAPAPAPAAPAAVAPALAPAPAAAPAGQL